MNVTTPCVRNARSIFVCAVAFAYLGERSRSQKLEDEAEAIAMDGMNAALVAPRLRLLLLRDDLEAVERTLPEAVSPPPAKNWWLLTTLSTRLDALVALGARRQAEKEAPPLLLPGTYLEPFALRALGVLREDHAQRADSGRRHPRREDHHARPEPGRKTTASGTQSQTPGRMSRDR